MIIRIVKLTLREETALPFLDQFNAVKKQIRSFPGCMHMELLTVTSDPKVMFTYSYWDSESSLEAYTASELFKSTWAVVKPWFGAKAEAWSLERLQTVDPS
jgi:heme-degrading monooxygenase HmoA